MLAGRESAARASWESVLAADPQGEEAQAARRYLDQLGPAPEAAVQP